MDKEFTPKALFTVVGVKEATELDAAVGGRFYDGV